MDLLSSVLRELRFESAAYRWLELGRPYQLGFDQPGLRGVHILARGECVLTLDGDDRSVRLASGDLVILPRGDSHVLRSPGRRPVATVSGFELAMRTPGNRLHIGGDDTVVVCGAFIIGEPDHPVLQGLPRVIHIPGQAATWLTPYIEVLQAEAFDGGRGSDLVMARLSDAMLVRALRHYGDTTAEPGWLAGLSDPYLAKPLQPCTTTSPTHGL